MSHDLGLDGMWGLVCTLWTEQVETLNELPWSSRHSSAGLQSHTHTDREIRIHGIGVVSRVCVMWCVVLCVYLQ